MTIPDISLRKSLIPEVFLASPAGVFRGEKRAPLKTPAWEAKVFLDCYCVARKRPLEVRKQCGKQISVNSHRNTFYTAEGKRELSFFFFKNRGRPA